MKLINSYQKKIWQSSAELNNNILISYVNAKKTAKILDIGVFRGIIARERFVNIKNPEIHGVDVDDKALSSAKKFGINVKKYNIEKGLPYKANFFDIVSANQIIEHLIDVDLFMSEIHRVLKPKGYLILSTENLSSWHNLFALFMGWQAFSQNISKVKNVGNPLRIWGDKIGEDIHRQIFTFRGLKELAQVHKFKIENTFGAGYYPFFGTLSSLLSKADPIHCAFIGFKARK